MRSFLDSYGYVIAVAAAGVTGFLAMVVTFQPPRTRRAQWLWLTAFAGLTLAGIGAAWLDHIAGEKEQKQRFADLTSAQTGLRAAMDNLHQSSAEIERSQKEATRIQKLNTELQERLIKSNAALATLSLNIRNTTTDIRENVTGGDTYAYVEPMMFVVTAPGELTAPLLIRSAGPHLLTGVTVWLEGVGIYAPVLERWQSYGFGEDFARNRELTKLISVGTLYPGQTKAIGANLVTSPLTGEKFQRFTFQISAQNGLLIEELDLRPSKTASDRWEHRLRLKKNINDGVSNSYITLLERNQWR